ncbi:MULTISPECIES: hypothetical protein [unclassified Chryseobacterium]|uniref:hypothetical protein n=1 Tax=unclassified Chryseobacterium TaxID=2593645 RepID=UPI000F45C870|nr:hypothetical protein [Chryseobacterium sp. G0240]ROI05832.1 hypothetical protein EGI16_05480 [Chryseobacterium sp. G0240]
MRRDKIQKWVGLLLLLMITESMASGCKSNNPPIADINKDIEKSSAARHQEVLYPVLEEKATMLDSY